MKLCATQPKGKYNSFKGEVGKIAPNILNRQFEATKPCEKWVTDVSEFHFPWGKVYLSPILDLYTREIVGYDISRHPNFRQTMNMLENAFNGRKDFDGMILHSDQGWQYPSKISTLKNKCSWNYPMVIKGAFFHEAVSHLFNRVKTQNR